MRKTLPCLILSVLLILFLTSCGKVDPLVGEYSSPGAAFWGTIKGKEVDKQVFPNENPLTLTVKKDGTYTWETSDKRFEGTWEHINDEDRGSFEYRLLQIDSSTNKEEDFYFLAFNKDGHDIGAFSLVSVDEDNIIYSEVYFDRIN